MSLKTVSVHLLLAAALALFTGIAQAQSQTPMV